MGLNHQSSSSLLPPLTVGGGVWRSFEGPLSIQSSCTRAGNQERSPEKPSDRWPECQTGGQSARQVARVPTTGEAIMTSFPVVGTLATGPVLPSDTIISRPEHVLPPPLSVAMCQGLASAVASQGVLSYLVASVQLTEQGQARAQCFQTRDFTKQG